jgi:hypothetical protein
MFLHEGRVLKTQWYLRYTWVRERETDREYPVHRILKTLSMEEKQREIHTVMDSESQREVWDEVKVEERMRDVSSACGMVSDQEQDWMNKHDQWWERLLGR